MNRDIIAIGGSAGSLDTLRSISSTLPRDFAGNAFVVVHIGHSRSQLPELLANAGHLPAMFPADGETITPGHIYVAPTDRHLLVEPPLIRLSRGPREHFTRPAIDPLFRSVASAYGERAIGVVLSGGGSDGATGLDTIKRAGGLTVVLDPQDAVAAEMPRAAIEIVDPDYVSSEAKLSYLVARLVREPASAQRLRKDALPDSLTMPERPYALTCPECGGTMRKIGNGTAAQFRCHIGHIFGAREMMPAQLELLEKALDVAQRALNERIELSRQMAANSRTAGRKHGLQYWERVRAEAEQQVDTIRRVLLNGAEAEEEPQDASE
jgi:two-component system chemotaxis response regulator CheB